MAQLNCISGLATRCYRIPWLKLTHRETAARHEAINDCLLLRKTTVRRTRRRHICAAVQPCAPRAVGWQARALVQERSSILTHVLLASCICHPAVAGTSPWRTACAACPVLRSSRETGQWSVIPQQRKDLRNERQRERGNNVSKFTSRQPGIAGLHWEQLHTHVL